MCFDLWVVSSNCKSITSNHRAPMEPDTGPNDHMLTVGRIAGHSAIVELWHLWSSPWIQSAVREPSLPAARTACAGQEPELQHPNSEPPG